MNHLANEALRVSRECLSQSLQRRDIDFEVLKESYWRIDGVKRLLQRMTVDDHPLVAHLEAAQRALMSGHGLNDRDLVRSALDMLPDHWIPSRKEARKQKPFDAWLRYRAWLSTRPRR
jgi:hypothetical protein